ncbi:SUKH-4 family immunity protein [Streptacidiphilus sp. PAMC 29251]
MPPSVDRSAFEAVLSPDAMVTLGDEALRVVSHLPSRAALHDVGLPDRPAAGWLDVAQAVCDGELTVGVGREYVVAPEDDLPASFVLDHWALLGGIGENYVYLDVHTGVVHCVPEDDEAHVLNTSLELFLYFLYLLEVERPHYDLKFVGGDIETGGSEQRLPPLMRAADSEAMAYEGSFWYQVLDSVAHGATGY